MDYNGAPRSPGRDTYMTIVLCAFVVIPTFVFLNKDGKEIGRQEGYEPGGAKAFIDKINGFKK